LVLDSSVSHQSAAVCATGPSQPFDRSQRGRWRALAHPAASRRHGFNGRGLKDSLLRYSATRATACRHDSTKRSPAQFFRRMLTPVAPTPSHFRRIVPPTAVVGTFVCQEDGQASAQHRFEDKRIAKICQTERGNQSRPGPNTFKRNCNNVSGIIRQSNKLYRLERRCARYQKRGLRQADRMASTVQTTTNAPDELSSTSRRSIRTPALAGSRSWLQQSPARPLCCLAAAGSPFAKPVDAGLITWRAPRPASKQPMLPRLSFYPCRHQIPGFSADESKVGGKLFRLVRVCRLFRLGGRRPPLRHPGRLLARRHPPKRESRHCYDARKSIQNCLGDLDGNHCGG
jgi:hypothetical protein